jgi:DNA-binding transcriptional MocR family regulator
MADQQRLPDVWASRDFPVLVEVTRRKDEGEDFVQASDVAEALGITEEQVVRAGYALKRRGLITASGSMAAEIETFDEVSAEAYFLTGLHPSGDDAVSALVTALRQAADQVEDPAEKSRLRSLADAALGISRDVMGGVLTAVLTAGITS